MKKQSYKEEIYEIFKYTKNMKTDLHYFNYESFKNDNFIVLWDVCQVNRFQSFCGYFI